MGDEGGKKTHNVFRGGKVHVMDDMCSTCVFRPGNKMHLMPGRLKDMVNEATQNESTIVCHDTLDDRVDNAACRGFFDRYSERSFPLRYARQIGVIEYDPQVQKDIAETTEEG